jgi:hypothetical protein
LASERDVARWFPRMKTERSGSLSEAENVAAGVWSTGTRWMPSPGRMRYVAFMGFRTEPQGYEKTILSDLQGAWENLRADVVAAHPFPESDRLLFHVDEGMSWESVRDLDKMRAALLLVRNLSAKKTVPKGIQQSVEEVWEIVDEVFSEIRAGKKL